MVMKTPAFPGGWLPTPGVTAAKRVQQRVRFDEQDIVTSGPDPAVESASEESQADGSVAIKSLGRQTQSPRSPRRIRVLDAFGNELTQTKAEPSDDITIGEVNTEEASAAAERRFRSSQKVTEQVRNRGSPDGVKAPTRPKGKDTTPYHDSKSKGHDHKDALSQLKASIAALKEEFDGMDDTL